MKKNETEKQESIKALKKLLKPGDVVYTILRHVSKSGMFRTIDAYIYPKKKPFRLSGYIADALGWKQSRNHYGIEVHGCGMDMGFHLVYSLGRTLWPNGNGKHVTNRNGSKEPETDGGYFLNQSWQ